MDNQTKQIFYLMLGCLCLWLVMSEFIGDKYITKALSIVLPGMSE